MAESNDETAQAEYVFTFDVIASDREGYYYDNWDRSNRFEVIGATKQAALDVLWPLCGEAPRGRYWKARQVGAATGRQPSARRRLLRSETVTPSRETPSSGRKRGSVR